MGGDPDANGGQTGANEVDERINGSVPIADAETITGDIPTDASLAVSGFGSVGYPKAVPLALAESRRDLSLSIVSGGSVGGEIDTAMIDADAIDRRYPFVATEAARDAINDGRIAFHDRHIFRLGDEVALDQLVDVDVAVIEAVAVGEDWLIPSTSVGHTPAFVEHAEKIVVEVNDAQPLDLQRVHDIYRPAPPPNREPIPLSEAGDRIGSPRVGFPSETLMAVVRTNRRDEPYTFREPTAADEAIGAHLASFIAEEIAHSSPFDEAIHLQFGVGSVGNALMSALTDVDFGDRTVSYYGEVIQDGLLDMLDADRLEAASATSLALSTTGQNRLFSDIDRYADRVVVRPADVSNHPGIINRLGVIGVNSALEVDLYGHANSTHVNGSHLVNGIGGSGDFTRNSLLPIVALPSTAAEGDISRIVPFVSHVDHTEHDLTVVITEQGVADLRGCSPRERAELLVERCAHPEFRPDLRAYLDRAESRGGHVPHDFESVFDWTGE